MTRRDYFIWASGGGVKMRAGRNSIPMYRATSIKLQSNLRATRKYKFATKMNLRVGRKLANSPTHSSQICAIWDTLLDSINCAGVLA